MATPKSFDSGFNKGFAKTKHCELVCVVHHDGQPAHPKYEDGDILEAVDECDSLIIGANRHCHVRRNTQGGGKGKVHAYQSLPWQEQHVYYQYKITQISNNEAVRENIDPLSLDFGTTQVLREPLYEISITNQPTSQHYGGTRKEALEAYLLEHSIINYHVEKTDTHGWAIVSNTSGEVADGYNVTVIGKEHMMVGEFFARRLLHDKHRVFIDDEGRQVYFGGRQDRSEDNVHLIWDAIEPMTGDTRENHRRMRWNLAMRKKYLILPVHNIGRTTKHELVAELQDDSDPENPVTIKARKFKIPWRDINDLTPAMRTSIGNRNQVVDLTEAAIVHAGLRRVEKTQ